MLHVRLAQDGVSLGAVLLVAGGRVCRFCFSCSVSFPCARGSGLFGAGCLSSSRGVKPSPSCFLRLTEGVLGQVVHVLGRREEHA